MRRTFHTLAALPPVRFGRLVAEVYFEKQVGRAAAELAYFLLLTVFPVLICLSQMVGLFHLDLAQVLDEVGRILPTGITALLEEYLLYIHANQSMAMLLTGLFMTLLFASGAVRGLMDIMGEIYGGAHLRGIRQIAASVGFALLLLVTVYAAMGAVVTGNWFFHLVGELLGLEGLAEKFQVWQWVKYTLLLAVVFLFILLLYRVTAPPAQPRPPVALGAGAASAALVGATVVFSWFISQSANYSLVYGSLASMVILLVWLYLCGNILILGSVVNCVRAREQQTGGG